MAMQPSDLTAFARIRNAALELYAAQPIEATSVRDVARAAGVSPGLVQHYFPTKAALRECVNEHVVAIATAAFTDLDSSNSPPESAEELGQRITAFIRDHPTALAYVARAVIEHDEAAVGLFDAFVALAHAQWTRLADDGLLHDDADIEWASLHVVVLNMATLLMEAAINRHLPSPILSPEGLERWRVANTTLFRQGVYRPT
jgi:AcrR family transcriptional regulator